MRPAPQFGYQEGVNGFESLLSTNIIIDGMGAFPRRTQERDHRLKARSGPHPIGLNWLKWDSIKMVVD